MNSQPKAMTLLMQNNSQQTAPAQDFNANALLDAMLDQLGLKNDAALSRYIGVAPPVISKIRHGTLSVGASMLIRLHEESGLAIRELRELMGDRRDCFRMSAKRSRSLDKVTRQRVSTPVNRLEIRAMRDSTETFPPAEVLI